VAKGNDCIDKLELYTLSLVSSGIAAFEYHISQLSLHHPLGRQNGYKKQHYCILVTAIHMQSYSYIIHSTKVTALR